MTLDEVRHELERKLKILSEDLWEQRCRDPDIKEWLSNFDGRYLESVTVEHLHALHLLSSVSYFGIRELRVLLKSMFRDLFRYPIIQKVRCRLRGTTDVAAVKRCFAEELRKTRFIGMGTPAESGTHLLYYFRQENGLSASLFPHQHELFTGHALDEATRLVPKLDRIVFVDDLCGSGKQSVDYSDTVLKDIKAIADRDERPIAFQYLTLFGTEAGLARIRQNANFDVVEAVTELDATYATFGPHSRVFRQQREHIDKTQSERLAQGYGGELSSKRPLGFGNCQLLLAFHHNVPNNSLPILWWSAPRQGWKPAFPRYPKSARF